MNFFYDENTYQKGHLNIENIKWSISCEKWEMELRNKGNVRDLQKLFVVIHREVSSNEGIHEHYKIFWLNVMQLCEVIDILRAQNVYLQWIMQRIEWRRFWLKDSNMLWLRKYFFECVVILLNSNFKKSVQKV